MFAMYDVDAQRQFIIAVDTMLLEISNRGYAPKEYYMSIMKYHAKHGNRELYDKSTYWHKTAPAYTGNIHKDYYMNDKGVSIHFSATVAKRRGERNVVKFGSSDKRSTKSFNSVISSLRRLAKQANDALDVVDSQYNMTPVGISRQLDDQLRKVMNDITVYLRRDLDYSEIQKTTGGNSSSWIFEKRNLNFGSIASVRYANPSFDHIHRDRPMMPTVVVHVEDAEHHALCNKMLEPLAPYLEQQQQSVQRWEEEQIINRLKGEVTHEN